MNRRHWYEAEADEWRNTQRRQVKELPDLLARLQQQSEMYGERLTAADPARIDSLEALAELPFTTKDDLRSGQKESSGPILGRQQAVPTDSIEQVISSSGTTGTPVYFGLTRNDRRAWTDALGAFYFTAGLGPGSIAALSTGMPIVAGGVPYADGIRETGAALVWFGGQTTARMVSTLDRLRVNTLVATASFSTYFAGRVEEELGRPATTLGVRAIVAGGEPGMGNPETRARVLERWGASRLSEVMGLGDVLSGIWAECDQGLGMHFVPVKDVLVELIDPATGAHVPWEEGASGEAVYTTLRREATPVLRFRSRDHLVVQGMDCPCGRRTPRVRCMGRTDDMLIYKAMNVFPTAIRDVALDVAAGDIDPIMRVRKERADQVRFDDPIPLEVQVLPMSRASIEEISERVEAAVRERLRVRVAVECLPAGSIEMGRDKNAIVYIRES